MKRKWIALLIVTLLMSSLACSLTGILKGVEEVSEKAQEVVAEVEDIAEESEDFVGDAADSESGTGNFDPSALDELDSYRMTMVMRFEHDDGTTEENTLESAYTRNPSASHTIMTGMMGADDESKMEIIQIANEQWIQMGEDWIYSEVPEDEDSFSNAMDFDELNEEALEHAKDLGKETINGIRCRHYLIDDEYYLLDAEDMVGEVEDGTMEIWIADEKNLPAFTVRIEYEVHGKGSDSDTIESFYMTMDVTDVNTNITIEPPTEAESGGGAPDDIPMLTDAHNKTVMDDVIFYETDNDFQFAVDFYATEMVNAGWSGPETVMSMDNMSMQNWTKGDRTAQVNIIGDDETGAVSITIMLGQ
ncbi:MAG: hypothetical protein DRI56_12900 [Chloroflexota bacterium]|nr:MAG: hypothetical protein DRI56_12900 [Chloroflexota bacterium]